MKKSFITLVFLLVAGLLGGIYYTEQKDPSTSDLDTIVRKRDFSVEINVVGVLDAARSHMVSSNLRDIKGKILFLIDDGVQVKKDDVLVKLDPVPYENQVEKLQAEVNGLKAAVQAATQAVEFEKNQVEREIANAEYNKNVALLDYKRIRDGDGPLKLSALQEEQDKAKLELKRHEAFYQDLLTLKDDGFDNQSEIKSEKEQVAVYRERFKTASDRYSNYEKHVLPALLEGARAKQENTNLLLNQLIQGGKHKIAKAQATLIQVKSKLQAQENSLRQALDELDKTTITAPLDGIVVHYEAFRDGQKRKPRVGDALFPNQPIMYLPEISSMIVKSKVREIDLHKLQLGQKADIRVDAYPNRMLTGELTYIGALATNLDRADSFEKYFQIALNLTNDNLTLRPGMTCRVSLVSKTYDDVLSLPVQAVFREKDGIYCFIKNSFGRYTKRHITIGGQNEDYVEVTSSLKAGDKVSLYRPDNL